MSTTKKQQHGKHEIQKNQSKPGKKLGMFALLFLLIAGTIGGIASASVSALGSAPEPVEAVATADVQEKEVPAKPETTAKSEEEPVSDSVESEPVYYYVPVYTPAQHAEEVSNDVTTPIGDVEENPNATVDFGENENEPDPDPGLPSDNDPNPIEATEPTDGDEGNKEAEKDDAAEQSEDVVTPIDNAEDEQPAEEPEPEPVIEQWILIQVTEEGAYVYKSSLTGDILVVNTPIG